MNYLGQHDIKALALARRSALPTPWKVVEVTELTREDMVLLASGAAPSDPRAPLARISAPHHMLARLVAEGKGDVEVSGITGYTPGRVRTLRNDPSFQDLVAHYEAEIVKTAPDITARVTHLALAAGEILQDRLETDPESFTKKELRELMTASLDRVGHGPTSKHTVQVNDPSGVIRNLADALRAESRGKIIPRETIEAEYTIEENEPNESPTPSSRTQINHDATIGPLGSEPEVDRSGRRGDAVPKEGLDSLDLPL